jgi:uncharacterized protein
MIVDIGRLKGTGEPLSLELAITDRDLALGSSVCALNRPARAQVRLVVVGDAVRVAGAVKAVLEVSCSRCLKLVDWSVNKEFDLEYHPDPEVNREGEEIELEFGDLTVGFYRNEQLDVSASVGEQIVLEIPMKPVCKESCEGLCDQCGQDLNEGSCSCSRRPLDPRLAMLADLKLKMNRKQ